MMSAMTDTMLDRFGRWLARKLDHEPERTLDFGPSDKETLFTVMRPADVLLVEGRSKISGVVKYLTQSTWSHSALYVGDALDKPGNGDERPRLVEVNVGEGCVAVPLSKYRDSNVRICRPVGLVPEDRERVVRFMIDRLGARYDMKNLVDLLRYVFPPPPVPLRFRRRMISVGSGDPTRAICSTLIAEAFQSVRYPILPATRHQVRERLPASGYSRLDIYHIRHHSLYAPRDFDLSPYFAVIKPTLVQGFEYKKLRWVEAAGPPAARAAELPEIATGYGAARGH
jgi:hypothetical protein